MTKDSHESQLQSNNDTPQNDLANLEIKFHYENAGGFGSKGKRVQTEFTSTDRDIICITETWLNNSHLNSEFFPNKFDIHRHDRQQMINGSGKGGGVMIAVRSTLRNEQIDMSQYNDINCVCIKVSFRYNNVFIYNGYVPPKDKRLNTYQRHIQAIRSIEMSNDDKLIVVGDFNLPGIDWLFDEDFNSYYPTNYNGDLAEYFLDELMTIGLFQYSNITNKCGNVLDYILFSEPRALEARQAPSLTAVAEKSENDDRFHYPIEWELEFETKKRANARTSDATDQIRSFKRASFEQINLFWDCFDVNTISATTSIDDAEKIFYDAMMGCIDEHVPLITPKNYSANHPPWFDSKLINLKNRRDKARKKNQNKSKHNRFRCNE